MGLKTINKVILLSAFSLFITIILFSVPIKAEEVNGNKIDEFIISKMKSEKIPGCSIAIVKGDKIIYSKGYGVDGKYKPVTEKTPFILGSLSKSFTGLAIAQLIDKGKIDLESPVQRYLPWFTLADSEASKQITIKQLLSHTSGFSRSDGSEFTDNTTIEQYVRNLKNCKISSSPGTVAQYSNINYVILGEVVQTISGMPYEKYIEENIFKPLDMKDSYTNPTEAGKNGLTNGYNSYFGFMLPRKTPSHTAHVPAGYLVSSSEDMAHYLIAEMNNGKYNNNSVISQEGMDKTHQELVSYYGMGWFTTDNIIYHDGDTQTFHSFVRMDISLKLGIVMLFNANGNIKFSKNGVYDDIPYAIFDNLSWGSDFPTRHGSDVSLPRTCINAAGILVILLLLIAFIFNIFICKKKLRHGRFGIINIIALTIVNILLPLSITLFVLYSKPATSVYSGWIITIPDLGVLEVLVPTVLFAIGIVKITYLVSYFKNRKRVKEQNMQS